MKVFVLALLVLNLMCFALGDKDQNSDFVDLDAADGDALPQVEDYVEDEEDPNVSRSQLLDLSLISQNVKVKLFQFFLELIINWTVWRKILLPVFRMSDLEPRKNAKLKLKSWILLSEVLRAFLKDL